MPTALFAAQQHHAFGAGDTDVHYIHSHPDKSLYIISESDYVSALTSQRTVCAKQASTRYLGPSRRIALQHSASKNKDPRPLMAAAMHHQNTMPLAAPGSPPDLTNSKSSKSSSFHSEGLSDMGPSDLSHFEDINLADDSTGPSSFPVPHSPNRILYEAPRSRSIPHAPSHSFRDLTKGSKSRPSAMKIQTSHNLRAGPQLHAPGKQLRRGFSSPSAPSLANITNLQAPLRRSRSPSPNKPLPSSSSQRSLSRKSSRNLEVSSMAARRQSWQHAARKSAKEREAECDVDDDDDELPEDAVIWNVPISPRPAQERSPAPSSCGSPPQISPSPTTSRPVSQRGETSSTKTSPAFSDRRYPSQPPTPDPNKENEPPALSRQTTNTWEETYGSLDDDARKLTEALEEYQTEIEHQQEIKRQQPLSRSSSVGDAESKKKKTVPLPPVRKSDPLIDPFQPSTEKEKYLSRTRPSWLPPKDPKEEKKHLKEYQKMLARIEEAGK